MTKVARLQGIEKEVNKAAHLLAVLKFELVSLKLGNRRDKIVNELNAFSQAIHRQIIPAKEHNAKIAALEAELQKLKQELGE